jgi:hypothetical protein
MSVASHHQGLPKLPAMEKSNRSDLETPKQLQLRLKRFSTDSPTEPPKKKPFFPCKIVYKQLDCNSLW